MHTNNCLMDGEWSMILCDCDGFLTGWWNHCPLPSEESHRKDTGHRLCPGNSHLLRSISSQYQGQTFCLFQNKTFFFFWIFKRWLPFIRFSWIYFFKAPGHKTDEFMIILAGVKKAESFVRRREITTSRRW